MINSKILFLKDCFPVKNYFSITCAISFAFPTDLDRYGFICIFLTKKNILSKNALTFVK